MPRARNGQRSDAKQENEPEWNEEMDHLQGILRAFFGYEDWNAWYINELEKDYSDMTRTQPAWIQMCPKYGAKLQGMFNCISQNQIVLKQIAGMAFWMFPQLREGKYDPEKDDRGVTGENMTKVSVVLKQLYRDWTAGGAREREECFGPLLRALQRHYPTPSEEIKVLTPGCGLGRLPWDIARLGYFSQANEFTYFMLLGMMLVYHAEHEKYEIFPWAYACSNHASPDAQLRPCFFPDVENPSAARVRVQSGDFLVEFRGPANHEAWDCIPTCFLLDATANILQTIQHIHWLLKPGGLWTNIGPLLYHHSDREMGYSPHFSAPKRNSQWPRVPIIELSMEELKAALPHLGFRLIREEEVLTSYNRDEHSLMGTVYRAVTFDCIKIDPVPVSSSSTLPR